VRRKKSAASEKPAQVGELWKRPAFTGRESLTFRVNNPLRIGRGVGFAEEFRQAGVNGPLKAKE
jgi:hypothetical protein